MSEVYKFHDGLFYPPDIKYESIPKDAVDVSEEDFIKAMSRPAGWNFSVDKKGVVTLTAPPPQTKEQLISTAEFDRVVLRQQADGEITWRQDAVDAEIATDEETAALAVWKKYRILLMRTDTSTAPDVKWPKQPGS